MTIIMIIIIIIIKASVIYHLMTYPSHYLIDRLLTEHLEVQGRAKVGWQW